MIIRNEAPRDREAIHAVITAAFAEMEHSNQTEARIVEGLRSGGALRHSLVAVDGDEVVGHVAFSPVDIDGAHTGWMGLGPVAVRPDRQGEGIGAALIREGLERLRTEGSAGCVVLGEPTYYGRFGFRAEPALSLPEVPPAYFQALAFGAEVPGGVVAYHAAFAVE